MADLELQRLLEASIHQTSDPLDNPAPSALKYLASLDISEEEIELLLGEAPGLSWADMKQDIQSFFFRLRLRVASLVCSDQELKSSVNKALEISAEAGWIALVGALGLNPTTLAASALKPIAVALVSRGVSQLCLKNS